MKGRMKKAIPLAVALALGSAGQSVAASFSDVVSANQPAGVGPKTLDMTMNSATITSVGTTWVDTNGNGLFDGAETLINSVHLLDRNGVQVLGSGPASIGWTPAQLDQWALDNALLILETLFPAGLSETTGATDDNMMVSATASDNLFKKATVARKSQEQGAKEVVVQEVRAEVEYIDLKVGDANGSAYGMIIGYAKDGDSGLDFTLTVPYRYSKMKDDIESESHFVGLDLALKYPVAKWDKSEWTLGGDIFGSAYYLESTAIDQAGNLKYGGGFFTSVNTDLGFGTLGVGIDYKVAKAYLPSGMNSDNTFLAKVVDYMNDLDPVHTISYGFNFGVPVGELAAVNLEVIRASFVSSDVPDGQENRTTVGLSGTYFPSDTFELNLGVRSDFELEDVDSIGVMLGVVHRF